VEKLFSKLLEMIHFALKEAIISLRETKHPPKVSKSLKNHEKFTLFTSKLAESSPLSC
jgi:hypothetical protein